MVLLRWSPRVRNRSVPCLHSWRLHSLLLPSWYIFLVSLVGIHHEISVIPTNGFSRPGVRRSTDVGRFVQSTEHQCRRETHLVISERQTKSLHSSSPSASTTTVVNADLFVIIAGWNSPTSCTLSGASNTETTTNGVRDERTIRSTHLAALSCSSPATTHGPCSQLYLSPTEPSNWSSDRAIKWFPRGVITAISSSGTIQSMESLQSSTIFRRGTRTERRVSYNYRACITQWLIRAPILNLSFFIFLSSLECYKQ